MSAEVSFRSVLDKSLNGVERIEDDLDNLLNRARAAEGDESCCEACGNGIFAGVSHNLAVVTEEVRTALVRVREASNSLAAATDELSILTHEQQASM